MRWRAAFVVAIAIGLAATADAQFRRGLFGVRLARPADFDGRWHFCRLVYEPAPTGTGGSWRTDFPRADINMSIRLSELTRTDVSFTAAQPNPLLVRPTDDALFQCPFVLMSAPGSAGFSDKDAARLREFVLKGGFLWADDFWGQAAWASFEQQMRQVLPAGEFPVRTLGADHPMFRMQFPVAAVKQIPSINFWAGSGGGTSEWGSDSAQAAARAFVDKDGRVLVLATHNTDYGDSWEREAEDPDYFYTFSVHGYAFGINVLLYALSH
jgi:hypothetical protein